MTTLLDDALFALLLIRGLRPEGTEPDSHSFDGLLAGEILRLQPLLL